MNSQLKNITVDGESLESYLSKEESKEHADQTKADIINMTRSKKRHGKTKMQSRYNERPKRINKGGVVDALTMQELKGVLAEHSLVGGLLFLLQKGNKVSGTWASGVFSETTGKNVDQGRVNAAMRSIKKTAIGKLIDIETSGLIKYHTLKSQFQSIDYRKFYKIYSQKFPDTIRDLQLKYPEKFEEPTPEKKEKERAKEIFDQADEPKVLDHAGFSKCPSCQYKSFDDEEKRCVACGYGESVSVDHKEEILNLIKKGIETGLKDINVNININVTFGTK